MPTTIGHSKNPASVRAELQSQIAKVEKVRQQLKARLEIKISEAVSAYIHDAHYQKLEEIRELAKGWDSYDAEPPSKLACDLAAMVLNSLKQHFLPVEFITATSDASILLKHQAGTASVPLKIDFNAATIDLSILLKPQAGTASVTWEIDDDGEIGVMVERAGVPPEYFSPAADGIVPLVADLARHG